MNFRNVVQIGRRFRLDEKESIGILLSFFSSVDDFVESLNEKKINYFKRERLSKKERSFIREVIHREILSGLIKEENKMTKSLLTEENSSDLIPIPKPLLFPKALRIVYLREL